MELFAEYHKENPNSRLLLVGDGELFETVQQQCTQLGIRDAVIMVGSKTNTEDYYQEMCIRDRVSVGVVGRLTRSSYFKVGQRSCEK